jgi:uncharacterized protein (UPF0548 family)
MRFISLQKPKADTLSKSLAEQSALDFSYPEVGATAFRPPAGYVVDQTRIELGSGERVFEAAKSALRNWQQVRLGWVDAWSPGTTLDVGQDVAILGWALGFWWLNCCRIVYTIDDTEGNPRFGFANGTLPGHIEMGEERFLIEWDRDTDRVSYEIVAFSKPNHFLSRLGYPIVRRNQKRFGRDSAAALYRAIGRTAAVPTVVQSTNQPIRSLQAGLEMC